MVFVPISEGFLRWGGWAVDRPRGGADSYGLGRMVEPLESRGVTVLLLLCRLLAHAIGAVIAGFVAVPREGGQVHEHDIAGLDDAVGEVAPVGPRIETRGDDDVLDVLHARDRIEKLHDVRRHLVFGEAGLE